VDVRGQALRVRGRGKGSEAAALLAEGDILLRVRMPTVPCALSLGMLPGWCCQLKQAGAHSRSATLRTLTLTAVL
jgi:hypothetical protein